MRTLGSGIIGRVGALALTFATIIGCGDNGIAPPDAQPIDAAPEQDAYVGPSISDVPDQTIAEDGTTGSLGFTVSDTSVAPGSLTVTATSNNTTLIPDANIVLGGSGANRTVTVTPAANQFGSATITLTVNNGQGKTASSTFDVIVTSQADAPTISPIADQTVAEGQATTVLPFTIADSDTPVANLTVTATSSNMTLVPNSGISITGTGGSRMITVTPATTGTGTTVITVSVSDGTTTTTETFTVTVTFNAGVNDPPAIAVPTAQSSNEDVALVFGPGNSISITDLDAGTGLVSVTLGTTIGTITLSTTAGLTFTTGDGTADTNLVFTGTLTAVNAALNGMTVTPAANTSGTGTLTITVNDQGNTGTGGPQSDTDTVAISFVTVNDLPTVSTIPTQTINEDTNTGPLSFVVGDTETPAGSLTVTATSSNTTLVPATGIVIGGAGASRTITVTPAANQFGSAIITVTVTDANGGVTTTTFTVNVTGVDDAPTITPDQGNTSMNLGDSRTFTFTVADAETAAGSLTVTATSSDPAVVPQLNVVVGGSGATRTVTVTPIATGSTTINISVSDGTQTTVDTFILVVNNINDAPITTVPGTQQLNVIVNGTPAQRDLQFNTANGNAISVSDPDAGTMSITVTVTANVGGTFTVQPTTGVTVGGAGSPLTLTGSQAAVNAALQTLEFVSDLGFFGTVTVTVTTNDLGASGTGGPLSDTETFTIQVNARPSFLVGVPNSTVNEDGVFTGTFTIADADTLVANVTTTGQSSIDGLVTDANVVITGTGATRTITVTPTANQNTFTDGTTTITITATDPQGGTRSDTFVLTVAPVNDSPVNTPVVDQVGTEDVPLVFSAANGNAITFTDVDINEDGTTPNQDASIRVTLSPGDGTLSAPNLGGVVLLAPITATTIDIQGTRAALIAALDGLTITPPANDPATGTLTIRVVDGGNEPGPAQLDVDVINFTFTSVNDAPTQVADGLETIAANTSRTGITVVVSDVDVGADPVEVTVSVPAAQGTITLTAGAIPPAAAFSTGDGTNDSLMVFRGTLAQVNAALANFTFTPVAGFTGDTRIDVTTNDLGNNGDLGGGQNVTSFIFTTVSGTPNTAPTISDPADVTINEDTVATVPFTISDDQSQESNLLVTVSPTSGANFTVALGGSGGNRTVIITPTANFNSAAPIAFTLTVSDGNLSDTTMFNLVITPVNDSPTITPIATQNINEDQPGTFVYTAADVDAGTTLTFLAFTDNPTLIMLGTPTATGVPFTLAANQSGSGTVTVSTSDGTLTTTRSFTVNVAPVNDAPTVTATGRLVVTDLEQTSVTVSAVVDGGNTFSLGTIAGLTFVPCTAFGGTSGDGVNDEQMCFTGTITAVNAALDDLVTTGGDLDVFVDDMTGTATAVSTTTRGPGVFGPN